MTKLPIVIFSSFLMLLMISVIPCLYSATATLPVVSPTSEQPRPGTIMIVTFVNGTTSFDAIRTGILSPSNMIVLVVLVVALGVALGGIFRLMFKGEGGSIWNDTFERINRAGGSTLLVITQSDKEYKGIASFASQSSPEEKKELIISSPTLVVRNPDGTVLNEVEMGTEILFINEDIKRIIILDNLEANGTLQSEGS
jgi:hypothetical protein